LERPTLKNPIDISITKKGNFWQIWVARSLIGVVLFWNLLAAFQFMFNPQRYISSFQVEGLPGQTAIIGFGILFLMWQVPYIFAFIHPIRFKNSLWQALIMQTIGVLGESILRFTIPNEYKLLRGSILRFIIFDSIGVLLLIGARLLARHQIHHEVHN
jgi:hypothetical protein